MRANLNFVRQRSRLAHALLVLGGGTVAAPPAGAGALALGVGVGAP